MYFISKLGGVNISKIHFSLFLALTLIFSVNAVSANEINYTNVGSDATSDDSKTSTSIENNIESQNTKDNAVANTNPTNTANDELNKETNTVNRKTTVSVKSSSVVNGRQLAVYLKNASGKGISGQKISINFANKKFIKQTNANGIAYLKINTKVGNYPVKINYGGNKDYLSSSKSFYVKVYKEKTKITASTSIINSKSLPIYLKNSAGKGISGRKISIYFNNKKFTRTTNANGIAYLKINTKAKTYSVKIKYAGSTSYLASSKSFKLKVYKEKTKISVLSKSVIRGKYMNIFLKNSKGNPIASKLLIIKFNKNYFYKYTNKNGIAYLKIISKPGTYSVNIKYKGSTAYLANSISFKAKSYLDKTKIVVNNSNVVKGNYLNAYLKNSDNKPISNQKVVINFNNTQVSKTTDSNGKVSLKINAQPNTYNTTIKFLGSTSYSSSSNSLNVTVIEDNDSIQGLGSGIPITKKTIVLNSDNIYNTATDKKLLNDIATILRSEGYGVIISNIGPNTHNTDVMGKYSNVCLFSIFGGVDSGMIVDMASNWYQYYLDKYDNQIVLGFTRTLRDLATETWIERAHDDNYSPESFTGLANPGAYLNNAGMDYVYGDTAAEIAENFLKYAINGLSIGIN